MGNMMQIINCLQFYGYLSTKVQKFLYCCIEDDKKELKNCFFIPQAIFPIMRYKLTKSHFCDELLPYLSHFCDELIIFLYQQQKESEDFVLLIIRFLSKFVLPIKQIMCNFVPPIKQMNNGDLDQTMQKTVGSDLD